MDNARTQLLGAAGIVLLGLSSVFSASCAAGGNGPSTGVGGSGGTGTGAGSHHHPNGSGGDDDGSGGGLQMSGAGGGGGMQVHSGDPKTCQQAAQFKTYIGCDFWPTVVGNVVWSVFDYAVVVAHAGDDPATVNVEQNGMMLQTATVAPNSLATIYLPWVPELKGPDANSCGVPTPFAGSVRKDQGAYHLTSTVPVTVYQFNALEYQAEGGPPGKDWSSCPAAGCLATCLSYSNDASLLLPSTAMTGNYRVTSQPGWAVNNMGAYFAVTGTQDGTHVTLYISGTGAVMAGGGIPATSASGVVHFDLDAGDVVEVISDATHDLSGTLVNATAPVQVVAGMPCVDIPSTQGACDHVEETVMPAETLGKHYFVPVPTAPRMTTHGHAVRIYGNVDNTTLAYPSGVRPASAPSTINAGEVAELGIINDAFEITGDHEFSIGTFLLGASVVDPMTTPTMQLGDPSQSQAIPVEQYRKKYVFLAPVDYVENYIDVIQPMGAMLTLDGAPAATTLTAIGSGFGVARMQLGAGNGGAHVLESDQYVGLQVIGYGLQTSYQYPGGLNLDVIAPPPPPPK